MIFTSTYRDRRTTLARDLLAAYSPLDHPTTAQLPPETVDAAFERVLRRLAVLTFLHGPAVPADFLDALTAHDADVVDLAAAFLETGTWSGAGSGPSELQQELVHFSRIVDIGSLGLAAGAAEHALRRLRGSQRLPDPLKMLSELVIVARSRLLQRGTRLPVPWLRPGQAAESEPVPGLTTAAPAASPDYWMVVRSQRRRLRRQHRAELGMLLEYLTPAEAALALWAHCHEQQAGTPVEMAVVQADGIGGVTVVSWNYQPLPDTGRSGAERDAIGRVAATLPTVTRLEAGAATTVCGHRVAASGPAAAWVTETTAGTTAAILAAPDTTARPTLELLAGRSRELLAAWDGPDVVSVEAAHIHLDRELDLDQDAGAAIGAAALNLLAARQTRPPLLTPMMDDDHVQVRLTPAIYRQYLTSAFGSAPMHLICESSPIVRAIVVALHQRLRNSRLANRLQHRGGNLFLPLDDGSHCELFEDYSGTPITGCVFFEAALLIYRSDPARFDRYFNDRYRLDIGAHEHAAAIMSRCAPSPGLAGKRPRHDTTMAALAAYYRRFADVTDPHRPDPHITALVQKVLDEADPVFTHLNVLEDYYEVQQHRVRELLRLLNLPLRLITLHFNAVTGRMVLTDD
ncbi:hypothetical protein [Actinomadura sp. 9N407]|uniref:hypothetical protein n=1 Tax=Actinomadura sp. 9N407 TaxID=3375154 RepID=UPI0037B3FD6B